MEDESKPTLLESACTASRLPIEPLSPNAISAWRNSVLNDGAERCSTSSNRALSSGMNQQMLPQENQFFAELIFQLHAMKIHRNLQAFERVRAKQHAVMLLHIEQFDREHVAWTETARAASCRAVEAASVRSHHFAAGVRACSDLERAVAQTRKIY